MYIYILTHNVPKIFTHQTCHGLDRYKPPPRRPPTVTEDAQVGPPKNGWGDR